MVSYGWVLLFIVAAFVGGFKLAEKVWAPLLEEAMAHWKEASDQRDRYFWKWFRS